MKRFLVFAGDCYYARGGMKDFKGDFDSLEEAEALSTRWKGDDWHWWHIYDDLYKVFVKGEWGGEDDEDED